MFNIFAIFLLNYYPAIMPFLPVRSEMLTSNIIVFVRNRDVNMMELDRPRGQFYTFRPRFMKLFQAVYAVPAITFFETMKFIKM